MKHNDWTQQLHDRLSDHKTSVPDGLWDKIESQLDTPVKKRSRTVTMRLATWIGAAAAILLLVTIALQINRDTIETLHRQPTASAVQKNAAMPTPGDTGSTTESILCAAKDNVAQAARALVGRKGIAEGSMDEAILAQNVPVGAPQETAAAATDVPASQPDVASGEGETNTHDKPATLMHTQTNSSNGTGQTMPSAYSSAKTSRATASAWSFGVHTGNIITESQQSSRPTLMQRNYTVKAADDNALLMSSYPLQLANYREAHHHNIPVSVGITASYAFGKRLALATGLVYTRAASDFTQSSGSDEISETQTLHYIGVPLAASYKVFSTGRLHGYVTAGAQADFNVSATLKTTGVSVGIKKDRPQFSVNAAVGVEYDIIPQLGLYAEPGVRYYIDNKSQIDNIFKDKPCNFSMQVGLRFNVK